MNSTTCPTWTIMDWGIRCQWSRVVASTELKLAELLSAPTFIECMNDEEDEDWGWGGCQWLSCCCLRLAETFLGNWLVGRRIARWYSVWHGCQHNHLQANTIVIIIIWPSLLRSHQWHRPSLLSTTTCDDVMLMMIIEGLSSCGLGLRCKSINCANRHGWNFTQQQPRQWM